MEIQLGVSMCNCRVQKYSESGMLYGGAFLKQSKVVECGTWHKPADIPKGKAGKHAIGIVVCILIVHYTLIFVFFYFRATRFYAALISVL